MVGVPSYQTRGDTSLNSVLDLFGEVGQVQVVRNHPYYKHPMSGITVMRDLSIPLNLGLYLAESEQRTAAIITDIKIDGFLCRCGLAVLVETLPGANPDNVEKAIQNLQAVEKRGLNTYLKRTEEERLEEDSMFRSFESSLNRILDDCLYGMGASITWTKEPKYACNCSVEKVWRALRLLPQSDIVELIETQNSVEVGRLTGTSSYVMLVNFSI